MSEYSTTPPAWAEIINVYKFHGVEKFYDIMPLLADRITLRQVILDLENLVKTGPQPDLVVSTEARGFLFGPTIACKLGMGFVPLRKPGKLPGEIISTDFSTEYSTDAFEMQSNAISEGDMVVLLDDLIATGGTLGAAAELVENRGGKVVKIVSLIELTALHGREILEQAGYEVATLLQY